jgi:hypothetical protein
MSTQNKLKFSEYPHYRMLQTQLMPEQKEFKDNDNRLMTHVIRSYCTVTHTISFQCHSSPYEHNVILLCLQISNHYAFQIQIKLSFCIHKIKHVDV